MSTTATEEPRWPELHRARRAIVVVDVVESVRLMQQHEDDVIDRWRRFVHEVRTEVLPPHGGRLVKSLGDGMLLEFESVPGAAGAVSELHRRLLSAGDASGPEVLQVRAGAHVADVVVDDLDIYGKGVNLAARLATLAKPRETVISADFRDALVPGLDADIEDLGECFLKHIEKPVRSYRLSPPGKPTMSMAQRLEGSVIAVVPFEDLSPAAAGAGQALAEELIGALSRTSRFHLLSRLSTAALAARGNTVQEIARQLGARYVVAGSVAAMARRLLVRVELSEGDQGRVIWSDKLKGDIGELLEPGDGLVQSIAGSVADAIDRTEVDHLASRPLASLQSYTLMVGGVALMHRTARADFQRAREILEHLVDRSGRHPLPRAWMAKWHVLRVQQGWSDDPQADGRTAVALTRAADQFEGCAAALAMTMEGFARANVLREFDKAEDCYDLALKLNPSDSLAWLLKGVLHAFRGEGQEAMGACIRAQALSPLDPMRYFYDALTASAALSAGAYDEAVQWAQRSLRLNCMHLSTYRVLTAALLLAGRVEEGRAAASRLLALDPGFTVSGFLERTPGRSYPISQRIAQAFREAGIPN